MQFYFHYRVYIYYIEQTYAYVSASRACGAIGADTTSLWSGNSWAATFSEKRSAPGGTDA